MQEEYKEDQNPLAENQVMLRDQKIETASTKVETPNMLKQSVNSVINIVNQYNNANNYESSDFKIMKFKVPMIQTVEISQEILNTPKPKKLSKEVAKREIEAAHQFEDASPWSKNKREKSVLRDNQDRNKDERIKSKRAKKEKQILYRQFDFECLKNGHKSTRI